MIRLFIYINLLALLSCSSGHSKNSEHSGNEHSKSEEQGKLLVTNPVKKDTFLTKKYVCQIHARRHIDIKALEKGYIEKINVNEGQYVHEGQLMFKILPRVYKAEVQEAKAEVKSAEIEYKNTRSLADSNIVSQ
ncbi:MAG: efflux RND transporter periplasmic adaptor subunit, partial [Flavobacteriales bacterium]